MGGKASHYTPASRLFHSTISLTNSQGFCLNCAPALGRVLAQSLHEYSPASG
jgi:hypothetical protein